mmetsp:Transcript_43533/g.117418  ORF Transcript_43533/g.117418 Transcript_43533/m.117418 type:complete len:371 (-) Transcript_43533:63-1175(-)
MRVLPLFALLCPRLGSALRSGRTEQKEAPRDGPLAGPLACSVSCAERTRGRESRSCPLARSLESKYSFWKTHRSCTAQRVVVRTECGDGQRNGGLREEIQRQLGGKHLVMLGDSTMRQAFIGLLCMLWEEGVFGDVLERVKVSDQTSADAEVSGYMNLEVPELGNGTNFTFVRKDSGVPGPLMTSVLDTADITVGNFAMHYPFHVNGDASPGYRWDLQHLLNNMSRRGRPGHRAFWREALSCPVRHPHGPGRKEDTYMCFARGSSVLSPLNDVAVELTASEGVELMHIADVLLPFWWAHPGGNDCCHFVGQVPGLLSATARMLVAMLSRPAGVELRTPKVARGDLLYETGRCPNLRTVCPTKGPKELVYP